MKALLIASVLLAAGAWASDVRTDSDSQETPGKPTLEDDLANKEQEAAEESQDEPYIAPFDWLVATSGTNGYIDGFLTLNEDDLTRFIATGSLRDTYRIGPLAVEYRIGTLYAEDAPNAEELSVPSSIMIKHKDRIMAGGKGVLFRIEVKEDQILIEHWNGQAGCSVSRWYMTYDLTPSLAVTGSEYVTIEDSTSCRRG